MTYELAFIGVMCVIAVFCAIVFMIRHERDAYLGRELRKAAGTESAARMAIESANLDRLLSQKFSGERDQAQRRRPSNHRLPPNVVRLVPRITSRGRELNFTPDGAA